MQRIAEDIKTGQLKQIYLLYGEEAYLIRQYRDKLKRALLGDGSDMNVNRFEGKGREAGRYFNGSAQSFRG